MTGVQTCALPIFILKDGSIETISLGNVAYKDVIETKEKLKEFAQYHNIKIN